MRSHSTRIQPMRLLRTVGSALMLASILLSVMPLQPVIAATYIDSFASDPTGGTPTDSFTTGTASTGLSYSGSPSDLFAWNGSGKIDVDAFSAGGSGSFTITSRDGNPFIFNSVDWQNDASTVTVTGTGSEPFTFTIPANSAMATYSPASGSRLVMQVTFSASDMWALMDNVNVGLDDGIKPDVTINQVGSQADPTNASPVTFTAVFDKSINDTTFTNADISVGGTATTGTVTVTEIAPNDNTTFEVSIVVTGDGTVVPSIPAGGVEDPAGNTNTASTSTDNSVTVDTARPDVTINQAGSQADPTNASPVVFTAVFDEPINDTTFTNADISVGGTATTGSVTVTEIAPNDDTTFEVSIVVTGGGTVVPSIPAGGVEDPAGNTNTASTSTDNSVTVDTARPDVTINQAGSQADPTNASPVVFTAVFDEPINDATFTNADISVGGTATTGIVTVTEIAPNDDTTFEVSIVVTGDGTVVPSIPAGGVEDPAGNTNTASTGTDHTITVDTAKPDVTINQAGSQVDPTSTSPVVFTAVFDEPINDTTFTNADVSIGGTATTGIVAVTEIAPNDNTTFEVSIVVSGDGTVVPSIPADGVEDPAGNTNTASTSTDNSASLIHPPTIDKVFAPDTIVAGDISTLTFTLTNPNSSTTLNGLNFTDTLPPGVQIAAAPNIGGSCNSSNVLAMHFTPNLATSGTQINLVSGSGYSLAPGTSCTISVDVSTVSSGTKVNTTGNMGSSETGTGSDTAAYTLSVNDPALTVNTTGAFGTDSVTSTPGTIDCPGTCSDAFTYNSNVTLNVSVDAGSSFQGWSGDCAAFGTALSGVITMNGSKICTATFVAQPEIDVQHPAGASIADGGTDGIGNQAPGTVNLTYTVDNTDGGAQLTITGVSADNLVNAGSFNLLTAVPLNVVAGATGSFDLSFNVEALGAFSLDLTSTSNDPDENPYDIRITGTGAAVPEIDVRGNNTSILDGDATPSTTDHTAFGAAEAGAGSVARTFTIMNTGLADLDLTGSPPRVTIGGAHAGDFTLTADSSTPIPGGSQTTFTITFSPVTSGLREAAVSIASNDADENPFDFSISGIGGDLVVLSGGNTSPLDGDILFTSPSSLSVQFNREVQTGGGAQAGDNPVNYLLVEAGDNGGFDTVSCLGGVLTDDTNIPVDSISYSSASYTAALNINSGSALVDGSYRLFICGTTSVADLSGNELNAGLADTTISFTIRTSAAVDVLPATGFTPGRITNLPVQPGSTVYDNTEMVLEIPRLDQEMVIVGVPLDDDSWNVNWLGDNAGYLAGSAYPTWAGNTVLTGHVWDALNQSGPFSDLKTLQHGDRFYIHAFGMTYTYEVRENELLLPDRVDEVFQHEELDWVTLLTCENYNPDNGDYVYRRAVRAVLVWAGRDLPGS